jgi:hypothetical protein
MRPADDVREVFRLRGLGATHRAITAQTGVSASTIKRWLSSGDEAVLVNDRHVVDCDGVGNCALVVDAPHDAYAYLLGQYLGDGHIVYAGKGTYRLEVACCAAYRNIIEECAVAIGRVLPANKVGQRRRTGVVNVGCYSKHLPCLFPQHGAGPMHHRAIVLEPWQEQIALGENAELFLRGLIHSDGWRGINRVRGANGSSYAYPRYQFSNRSADIRRLFVQACDATGVATRQMNQWTISVARRESVARLDRFIGPKA